MWTSHDNFVPAVGDFWSSISFSSHPIYVMMTKLKMLCSFLRKWNKDIFGLVDSLISKAKLNLLSIQMDIET